MENDTGAATRVVIFRDVLHLDEETAGFSMRSGSEYWIEDVEVDGIDGGFDIELFCQVLTSPPAGMNGVSTDYLTLRFRCASVDVVDAGALDRLAGAS